MGPTFWNRGGSRNPGIMFQKDGPGVLEHFGRGGIDSWDRKDPKSLQICMDFLFQKDGPNFLEQGGGLEIPESCSKKMGPDFWISRGGPGTLKSPKVGKYGIQKSANPRGGGWRTFGTLFQKWGCGYSLCYARGQLPSGTD